MIVIITLFWAPPPPPGHPPVARVPYYLYTIVEKFSVQVYRGIAMRPRPQWGQGWRKGGYHHYEKRISKRADYLLLTGKFPFNALRRRRRFPTRGTVGKIPLRHCPPCHQAVPNSVKAKGPPDSFPLLPETAYAGLVVPQDPQEVHRAEILPVYVGKEELGIY